MCACENNPAACLCQIFDSYAAACAAEMVNFDWKNDFPRCSTPCASSPCFNGATCVDEGATSYTCQCRDGYVGDRCDIKDVCDIPARIAYGDNEINYEVTLDNVTTLRRISTVGAQDLDYDPVSRRLFYYNSDNFYSIELDGSDLKDLGEVRQVTR
ncbi:fibropellin-1-like, partial [Dendronephthya gigantea]|uniref:fibropellin-1-like n=1 Tax=Dendronephthya gigantea TaxID=151771 RepID=UPI001069ABE1